MSNSSNTQSNVTERQVPQAPMHTPAPWRLKPMGVIVGGEFHQYANGSAQSQLAMVTLPKNSTGVDPAVEREANARLIAAAPELLAALTDACAAMAVGMTVAHKTPGSNDALITLQIAFANARSVIIKAKAVA